MKSWCGAVQFFASYERQLDSSSYPKTLALVDRAPTHVPTRKRDAARAQLPNIASPATRSTVSRSINSPRQGSTLAEVLALLGRDAGTAVLRDRFVLERIKRFQLRMRLKEQAATQAFGIYRYSGARERQAPLQHR
jgi:hypothetical protein